MNTYYAGIARSDMRYNEWLSFLTIGISDHKLASIVDKSVSRGAMCLGKNESYESWSTEIIGFDNIINGGENLSVDN